MLKKFSQQKGFTIVELLIVLAITSVLLGVVFSIFILGNKAFDDGTQQGFMQKDARVAAQLIAEQLRNAKEISTEPIVNESTYYLITIERNNNNTLYHLVLKTIEEGSPVKETSLGEEFKDISFEFNDSSGLLHFSLIFENYNISSAILLNNIKDTPIIDKTNRIYFTKY